MIQSGEHLPRHVLVARLLERSDPVRDLARLGLTIGLSGEDQNRRPADSVRGGRRVVAIHEPHVGIGSG